MRRSPGPCIPTRYEFSAAPGEANVLAVSRDASGNYTFTDTLGGPVTAVADCTQLTPSSASCPVGIAGVIITLGDRDDSLRLSGRVTPSCVFEQPTPGLPNCLSAFGEAGDDSLDATLVTGRGIALNGGADDDRLTGGAGSDLLDGADGADQMSGRGGIDEVAYFDHTTDVVASIDGAANDGTPGVDGGGATGADAIAQDVEDLVGGPGNDRLTGSNAGNEIAGAAGVDVISGLGGGDTLRGGSERDSFSGGAGTDKVSYADHQSEVTASLDGTANDGTPGVDGGTQTGADLIGPDVESLEGSVRADTLVGNEGNNVITGGGGIDRLDGREGADLLDANDGTADSVRCGVGSDTALVDLQDRPPGFPDCEIVSQAAVDQHPTVEIRSRSLHVDEDRGGRPIAKVELRCPRALHGGCRGALAITMPAGSGRTSRSHGSAIGHSRYGSIAAGSSRKVAVAIKPGAAEAARRRGGIEVRVDATERDQDGMPKESLKTLRLSG